jgi:threonine dehydratase
MLDVVIAPVGGGGLLSGTAISVKAISPTTNVIAAEPVNANDAYQSFLAGKIIPAQNPMTICDGLLTSLGELTFPIIKRKVDDIYLASEQEIMRALTLIWERMKIIVEPSAAVSLAIVLANLNYFKGKKVGIILSGGNVDFKSISAYF